MLIGIILPSLTKNIELATKWCGGQAEDFWLDQEHSEVEVKYQTKDIKTLKPVVVAKRLNLRRN